LLLQQNGLQLSWFTQFHLGQKDKLNLKLPPFQV